MVMRRPGDPSGQYANLYPRYGPPGSGSGPRGRLDVFYAPHPEHVFNAPHNWAKISDAAAKRLDTNIAREIDAEFRKQEGLWG